MATGYEVKMYSDVTRIADALTVIARTLDDSKKKEEFSELTPEERVLVTKALRRWSNETAHPVLASDLRNLAQRLDQAV